MFDVEAGIIECGKDEKDWKFGIGCVLVNDYIGYLAYIARKDGEWIWEVLYLREAAIKLWGKLNVFVMRTFGE